MFVLLEVEETGYMDLGTKRDGEGNQYVQAKPENVHETPLDVFIATIQLLKERGYNPRYSMPTLVSHANSAYLSSNYGLCPNEWGFVDVPQRTLNISTSVRFIITKPKSEQTEMEKWKFSMPMLSSFVSDTGTVAFSAHDAAMAKWIHEMPK